MYTFVIYMEKHSSVATWNASLNFDSMWALILFKGPSSMEEHLPYMQEVGGSIGLIPLCLIYINQWLIKWPVNNNEWLNKWLANNNQWLNKWPVNNNQWLNKWLNVQPNNVHKWLNSDN